VEKISDLVRAKKLQGIADLIDLTDHEQGLRLVIEVKNGINPDALADELYDPDRLSAACIGPSEERFRSSAASVSEALTA